MLSKRSSCDLALRRADWRRFWPLLFLYAATWLMALPMSIWNRRWSVYNADTLQDALRRVESTIYDCVTASVVVSAIFAVLLAMTLYGYLMNSRSVGLMHSLPVNRTKQFFNHFLVGVEIFTMVHIVTVIISVLVMSSYGVISWEGILTWFAVAELTSLFFFSLATLCAMVTGWVIAIPVIYVGVNAMFVAFYGLLQMMFDMFYWGYSSTDFPVLISWLTPFERLLRMASNCYNYDHELREATYHMTNEGWTALIVYTLVAVVFTVVAWIFYKARRSESAGDAIVFDWLRPIVLYVMSVVGGLGFGFLLYYLADLANSESLLALLVCQIIGGVVVYFAVQMLLNKSFKVFNRRGWLGAALLAVMLIVISAVVKFDLLGYERFVPEEDKVVSVDFSGSMMAEYIYTEDAERIEKITAIHRAILAQGETSVWEYEEIPNAVSHHFSIDYDLTNGTRVRRNYNLTVEKGSELHQAMNEFMNLEGVYADSFFRNYDAARTDTIVGGYYHNYRDKYYARYAAGAIIDAETGDVITESYAPVKEVQLTAEQATALYEAVGQHIQRKSRENIDALATGYSDFEGSTTYQIEIHFSESDGNPTDMSVDTGYLDAWYISNFPADCTEVMDLIIDFGFANSYDELLNARYN
ncbi:MAG: hypothetical protein IJE94_01330 [Oscillospiraceae bacterium]|nr:hypothetical protein [Oscillospiraceae bacterium]